MKKKRSWSGIIGLLMLVAGAKLFFTTESEFVPMWVAWLVGPILWYGGFISVCYWFLRRIFALRNQAATEKERTRLQPVSKPKAAAAPASSVSNCEFVRPGVAYSKFVLIGITL